MTPRQYVAIVRAAYHVELARAQHVLALVQAGLDPAVSYDFDDATLTATPRRQRE